MWRCGSTYVWSRFRALEQTLCFYEPLHHGLSRLSLKRLRRQPPAQAQALRHPAMEAPYFAEYEVLLGQQPGVRRFVRRFAFSRYALAPHEPDEGLQHYLCCLLDAALMRRRAIVAGFNGSDLRIGWMKARFNAMNIALDRDPYALWCSYMEQKRNGNFTFLMNWLRILEANAGHPAFAPLVKQLKLPVGGAPFGKAKARHRRILEQMSAADTYLMVCYFWMAYALHALSHCDLWADMDRLNEPGYRVELTDKIAQGCGHDVDLSQARTAALAPAPPVNRQITEWRARTLFPLSAMDDLADLDTVRRRLSEISPRKAVMLRLLLDTPAADAETRQVRAA